MTRELRGFAGALVGWLVAVGALWGLTSPGALLDRVDGWLVAATAAAGAWAGLEVGRKIGEGWRR
jgi:hypothetical protein